jgi:hypothetical protein
VGVGDGLPEDGRRPLPHLRQELERPLERHLVLRVREEAQVREDVLDVRLLEEAKSRADLVRDAATGQLDLELQRLEVGPVEDADLGEGGPLVAQLEDPLRDELGLLQEVLRADDGDRDAALARRDEGLLVAARVERDRGVGEPEDLRRRAVVRLEAVDRGARIAVGEAEERLGVGAAKGVDRLGVVADDHDVLRLRVLREEVDDLRLEAVHVLELVDEDGAEAERERLPHLRVRLEEPPPVQEEVVVVHRVREDLPLEVAADDGLHRLELREEVRVVAPDHGVELLPRVRRERDDPAKEVPLREASLGDRDAEVRRGRLEEVLAVLGVEDREIRPVAEELGVGTQEPRPDGVERPGRHPGEVGSEEPLDPPGHLPGGPVREGQEEDRLRSRPVLDEAGDPVDERPGLPRAGPRDDDRGPVRGEDDRLLLGVQLPPVVDPVAPRRRHLPEDVALRGGGRGLGRHRGGVSRARDGRRRGPLRPSASRRFW